ncbi:response regulator [Candidatus Pacearchaeota archaeon]|nr:response regulator [Candidatus Pacearchaeota archaeon]
MKKIILLEDEITLGSIYKKNLEKAGYEVVWLKSTLDINKTTKEFKADLIILDHGIRDEEKSGLDLIPAFKKKLPQAKIIMLSNYSSFQLEKKALNAGAMHYLVKINTSPSVLGSYVDNLFS